MNVEIKRDTLLVSGRICTPQKALRPFQALVKKYKNVIEEYLKQQDPRAPSVNLMLLGSERIDVFTPSGEQFLKSSKVDFRSVKKQHIRRSLHPFWDAIVQAGLKPIITNGSVGGYAGYFLSVTV